MKRKFYRNVIASVLIIALMGMTACSGNGNGSATDKSDESSGTTVSDKGTDSSPSNATLAPEEEPSEEPAEKSVEMSAESGIYPKAFELSMTAADDGEIYYTLDGSDPTTSGTAQKYTSPVKIKDRTEDKNVVTAVDTTLFSGNYNVVNSKRDGFECEAEEPSDNDVDKCTVVRAAEKKSDGSFSGLTSSTYFIGTAEEHIKGLAESCEASGNDLAVISISMNYDDLFDSEKGIYVKGKIFDDALAEYLKTNRRLYDPETARSLDANYKQRGKEWERQAAVTMFEFSADGATPVIAQECGIRIQGNYSRSDLQKAFRLYARSGYGSKNFKYAVFGDEYVNDAGETMDKFKTLVLRAGGNSAFNAKFNDTYWQSLLKEADCETKESRPCVVYLNGEYWGLYILEEDYSDDYFEDLHGVVKEDVVVYKGDAEKLELGYQLDIGDIPDGEKETYYFNDLLEFFKSHKNIKSQSDYDEFIKLVDPQSVMDYFAAEIWINNKWDWPGKNWSMWKTINTDESNEYADGRWRFMYYDMEFGGVSGKSDCSTNTVKEDNYKPNGLLDMGTDNPAVLCFAYLMTNDGFRSEFYERLTGLSEGYFAKTEALAALEKMENIYSPLYEQFFSRFPGIATSEEALTGDYASVQCIRDFLSFREKHIEKMIKYCDSILGS